MKKYLREQHNDIPVMQETRKFALDVGLTFIASSISMLLGIVITVFLGRHLGAGDLGLYKMTSTFYTIAILVAGMGITAAMIKYVAEYRENSAIINAIVSSCVITSLFIGTGFSILFYLSAGVFERLFNMQGLSILLKLMSPVFPFALLGGALLGFLNGIREMKKYGMAVILQSVLMVTISVPLIYYGFGVAGAIIGIVLSSVGSCLFLIRICSGYFKIAFKDYITTTKKLFKFGYLIFVANAINMVIYQTDILMIGYFLTSADVGHYGVALGLSNLFSIIPRAIQIITYPAASEYWANDHTSLRKMIDKSMKYTACCILPIGLGIGFFAEDIITLIFGRDFIPAVLPLRILIIGTVISNIIGSVGGSLASVGHAELNLKIASISAIISIILNLLLIPLFGINGASIATSIAFTAYAFLTLLWLTRVISMKIDKRWYLKIVCISTMFIFLYFIGVQFVNRYIMGFGSLGAYVILVFAVVLTEEDKRIFKSTIFSFIPLGKMGRAIK